MGNKRKCPICNNLLGYEIDDLEHVVPYKGRYAHITCFNNMLKITNKEKKLELAEKAANKKSKKAKPIVIDNIRDGLSEEEYKAKKAFFNKLRNLLKTEELEAKLYKVADDYVRKYKFDYAGMEQTLEYYYGVLGKETYGDCIGIIPYKYSEAQAYYQKVKEVEETNNELLKRIKNISDLYKAQVIKIKPREKVVKQIDISEIGGENSE